MENLNETIQFLIQSLQTYTGNNPIWILYPVALILIWFLGKKGDRKLFIGVFVTECLTIFNPFCRESPSGCIWIWNTFCQISVDHCLLYYNRLCSDFTYFCICKNRGTDPDRWNLSCADRNTGNSCFQGNRGFSI